MTERRYTVGEIDNLRAACEMRFFYGTTAPREDFSASYDPNEKNKAVEEMVRTYMLAGITADDIRKADDEATARFTEPENTSQNSSK